jgi:hypothetical protein
MNVQRSGSLASAALLAAALVVAACGSSSSPGSTAGGGNPGGNQGASLPGVGGGSCSVSVTGDMTASWQKTQDSGSVLVSYWLSASEKALLESSPGEESFLLNCQSDNGSVSLYTTNGTTGTQFPKAPGAYVISAGGIMGADTPGQVSLLVTFNDDSLWRVAEPGTFTVTTFTGSRFAGTFQARLSKLGDDLQTVVGTANLSGTFDFGCTSGGCSQSRSSRQVAIR